MEIIANLNSSISGVLKMEMICLYPYSIYSICKHFISIIVNLLQVFSLLECKLYYIEDKTLPVTLTSVCSESKQYLELQVLSKYLLNDQVVTMYYARHQGVEQKLQNEYHMVSLFKNVKSHQRHIVVHKQLYHFF